MDEEDNEGVPEEVPAAAKSIPQMPEAPARSIPQIPAAPARSVPKMPPAAARSVQKVAKVRNPSSGDSKTVQALYLVRQPLADLQEARGFPRNEEYSFVNLITSLCHHTYNAAMNIFDMMCNLLPLFDGFLYFLRFVIEKLIDIFESTDMQDQIMKSVILVGELIVLFLLLFFIMSVLLYPLFSLAFHFLRKILNVAFGH